MKTLYLLRHAEADSSQNWEDFDRPLSSKGLEDAQILGKIMATEGYHPDTVICSPAKRTEMTLKALNLPTPSIHTPQKLYLGTADDYIHFLQNIEKESGSALLIGHNPSIHETVRLLSQYRDDVRLLSYAPCTFTILETNIESWSALSPAKSALKNIITPHYYKL